MQSRLAVSCVASSAAECWAGYRHDGVMGKVILTVLGMVAEMELSFIRDRQRTGIEAAKAKGAYKGRPVTLDHAKIAAMRAEVMGAPGSGGRRIAPALHEQGWATWFSASMRSRGLIHVVILDNCF
jgi:hypothetical protein